MFYRSLYHFSQPARITASQRMAALGYLALGLGLPFILPLKHSMTTKEDDTLLYGHFNERSAFRI